MAEKRKDTKGRVLRNGEVQRADGKYMFRYVDVNGDRQTVYSWKLVETDKLPTGKRDCEALRTIEKRVLKDIEDGIDQNTADHITVNNMFDKYLIMKSKLKDTTRANYICLYDTHIRNGFGKKKIGSVKYSDVFKFYMSLSNEKGLKVSSIQSINSIIWKVFQIAEKDGLIRRNAAEGVMKEVIAEIGEDKTKKHALTVDQQSAFLDFIYSSDIYSRYAGLFTVLLGTGMRIGEALGLTWSDIDFKKGFIVVSHSIRYKNTSGKYEYHISEPKTKSGKRMIPMFDDVRKVFHSIKKAQLSGKPNTFTVDGYSGFIFINSAGKVYTPAFVYDTIQNIVTDYNRDEMMNSALAKREPLYLPKIGAHSFRHTFCTRLCEQEPNLKIIQDVMGHKNIRTTMDVYNEATAQAKTSSFKNLEGKIRLA